MTHHPDIQLSAYLDGALALEERRGLDAHLAACPSCRTRLAELRAVSGLLARLPERAPRRSLLPRRLPGWLVPARWASTLAAAGFTLLFAASLLRGVPLGAGAPVPQLRPGAEQAAPAAAPSATADAKATAERDTFAAASPSATPRATPVARRDAPPDSTGTLADRAERTVDSVPPWAWLAAALASGGVAIGLRRTARRRRA